MSLTAGVIINIGSGGQDAEAKVGMLREAFRHSNIEPEFFLAHDGEGLSIATEKALVQGHKIIVAVGGDGTINAVAGKLLHSNATLGIVPMGTFNHSAKDLGIPLAVDEAVAVLAQGQRKLIDVGQVNNRIFLNNSSIGLYPKLVRYREDRQKAGWGKWLALPQALVSAIRSYTLFKVALMINGRSLSYKTPFVFIGNNDYEIEGLNIGTRQNLDRGVLCVYVTRKPGRLGLLILAWHALRGKLRQHKDFDEHITTELQIDHRKFFLRVAIDGEVQVLSTPLKYKIIPQALRVIAPKA